MNLFHKSLKNRWNRFSLIEQMANIGAEVSRAINWRKKGKEKIWKNAFYRALELIDFTVDDPKNKNSLKEILRVRELLVDYFMGNNLYQSTDEEWNKYFYFFTFAAARKRAQTSEKG